MLTIEGRTNFGDLFEKNIWIKSMPESEATWLIDKNKKIYAAAGFGATLRDWGRLATHALAMRNGSEGACIESYMRNATQLLATDNQKKDILDMAIRHGFLRFSDRKFFFGRVLMVRK